jgi:hypothetical protein
VLRVGMPDRPGALGAVAGRIGAVRADVVGIEILTRADGRAMDEIAIEIDRDLLPLLLSEIAEVDGVVVEEVRMLPGPTKDRRLDAYRTAAILLEARTPDELLSSLAARVNDELDSGWVAVLDTESELILASEGRPPGADWLAQSFQRDANRKGQTDPASGSVSEELIWVVLARFDAVLATGRPGWSFSDHDRQRLHAMSHLADARWSELARRSELVRSSEMDTKSTQQLSGEPRLILP